MLSPLPFGLAAPLVVKLVGRANDVAADGAKHILVLVSFVICLFTIKAPGLGA
jgi:hypothetical protein